MGVVGIHYSTNPSIRLGASSGTAIRECPSGVTVGAVVALADISASAFAMSTAPVRAHGVTDGEDNSEKG